MTTTYTKTLANFTAGLAADEFQAQVLVSPDISTTIVRVDTADDQVTTRFKKGLWKH